MSTERTSKRRRLSPADEDHNRKRTSKSQSTTNGTPKTKEGENKRLLVTNEELPAVKGLDSSDAATRRKTLTSIFNHLKNRSPQHPLSKTESLQLWRGFHVAIYMHDSRNAISVQNLLHDIANTFTTISVKDDDVASTRPTDDDADNAADSTTPSLTPYHEAFWETMVREWAEIDSHRMNKYLLLIRLVMRQLFGICITSLDGEVLSAKAELKAAPILDVLRTVGPLNPKDLKIPNGLRLHVLDVWTDEICTSLSVAETKEKKGEETSYDTARQFAVDFFREAIVNVAANGSGAPKVVRLRAKDVLADLDERVSVLKERNAEDEQDESA